MSHTLWLARAFFRTNSHTHTKRFLTKKKHIAEKYWVSIYSTQNFIFFFSVFLFQGKIYYVAIFSSLSLIHSFSVSLFFFFAQHNFFESIARGVWMNVCGSKERERKANDVVNENWGGKCFCLQFSMLLNIFSLIFFSQMGLVGNFV